MQYALDGWVVGGVGSSLVVSLIITLSVLT